jgi:dihydroorotase
MYDLVVKSGEVIDPAQGIHECMDIAVSEGKIAAVARQIPASEAKRIIDAQGKIVTAGLIDLHQHVCDAIIPLGTSPDAAGVSRGVTTVCDAGSTGYTNFLGFKKYVIPEAQTDVLCFLNICPTGLALMPEIRIWDDIDAEATLKTAVENRDIVKGIKIRAVGSIAENLGIEAIKYNGCL